ncbi:MAG: hypothetical protein E7190_00520 [Erysipelotrichaceae bacterium]|nr:hypothetical protein [Erysipelotrichaceae bacterium]
MRLINVEPLSIVTWKDTEGMPDTFDSGVQWAFEQMDKQPTVPAVPISFIKERMDGFYKNGYTEFGACLETLIEDWRKGNDTRDGN